MRLLLLAAVVSFVISFFEADSQDMDVIPPWVEPAVIFTILILNALIGIWQDYNAEKAIEALKDFQIPNANVLRNAQWEVVSAK